MRRAEIKALWMRSLHRRGLSLIQFEDEEAFEMQHCAGDFPGLERLGEACGSLHSRFIVKLYLPYAHSRF